MIDSLVYLKIGFYSHFHAKIENEITQPSKPKIVKNTNEISSNI